MKNVFNPAETPSTTTGREGLTNHSVSKQEVRSHILFSLHLHTNSTRTTSSVCVTFISSDRKQNATSRLTPPTCGGQQTPFTLKLRKHWAVPVIWV